MSAIWQTIIGAAAAIAGGLVAAWWQTARADDVAQRIRRGERREEGLLTLSATVTTIVTQLQVLYRQARYAPTADQYKLAVQLVQQLRDLWYGTSSGMVPDQSIRMAFDTVEAVVIAALPGVRVSRQREDALSKADDVAGQRFLHDLDNINQVLVRFRIVVSN